VPPATHLGEHWAAGNGFPKYAEFGGGAHGDHGWVVVGDCADRGCGTGGGAQAFWSPDGVGWSRAPVKAGKDVYMEQVAWAGSSYYAAGMRYPYPTEEDPATALFWRSSDGRSWDQASTIALAGCALSCPYLGPIAANGAGTIVVGWLEDGKGKKSGTYVSSDAVSWTRIPPSTFGLTESPTIALTSTGSGFVMVLAPWREHGQVWASTDGVSWTAIGTLDANIDWIGMATDGRRIVAQVWVCRPKPCHTEMWASDDGAAWSLQASFPDDPLYAMAWSGNAFVAAGWTRDGLAVRKSVDGLAWTQIESDLSSDTCNLRWAAGGNAAILVGDNECNSLWYSGSQ